MKLHMNRTLEDVVGRVQVMGISRKYIVLNKDTKNLLSCFRSEGSL